jgi:signal recognition particle GTPase
LQAAALTAAFNDAVGITGAVLTKMDGAPYTLNPEP